MESNNQIQINDEYNDLNCCAFCGKSICISDIPILLPCCHSACKLCLENEQSNVINGIINKDISPVLCRLCNNKFSLYDCIENIFDYQQIQNNYSNSDYNNAKKCHSCEGQNKYLIFKCDICNLICKHCFLAHKKLKSLKQHKLLDIRKAKNILEVIAPSNRCSTHNKSKKMYCETCNTLYCSRCILKEHSNHKYEESRVCAENLNKEFKKYSMKIISKKNTIESTLKKIEEKEADLVIKKILAINSVNIIIDKVNKKLKDLTKSIHDQVKYISIKDDEKYQEEKKKLFELNKSFLYMERFIEFVSKQDDPDAVILSKDIIKNRLLELLKKKSSEITLILPFTLINVKDELLNKEVASLFDKKMEEVFKLCCKIEKIDNLININENIFFSKQDKDTEIVDKSSVDPSKTIIPNSISHKSNLTTKNIPILKRETLTKNYDHCYNKIITNKDCNTVIIKNRQMNNLCEQLINNSSKEFLNDPSKDKQITLQLDEKDKSNKSLFINLPDILSSKYTPEIDIEKNSTLRSSINKHILSTKFINNSQKPNFVDKANQVNLLSEDSTNIQTINSNKTVIISVSDKPEVSKQFHSDSYDSDSTVELENDDVCSLCQNFGNLIFCNICTRGFHLTCHIPVIKKNKTTNFLCTFCSVNESVFNQSNRNNKDKQKIYERLLINLYCDKKSKNFHQPMLHSMLIKNESKIENPMDFSIIKENIALFKYKTEKEFVSDVKLIFSNFNKLILNREESNELSHVNLLFKRLLKTFLPDMLDFYIKNEDNEVSVSKEKRARFL